MSLAIRFAKSGRRGERKYRIVVKEKRSKRDGKATDIIGYYEKKVDSMSKKIDMKRLDYWISKGAKMSPAVEKLLNTKAYSSKAK